jgi:hypothetical protein
VPVFFHSRRRKLIRSVVLLLRALCAHETGGLKRRADYDQNDSYAVDAALRIGVLDFQIKRVLLKLYRRLVGLPELSDDQSESDQNQGESRPDYNVLQNLRRLHEIKIEPPLRKVKRLRRKKREQLSAFAHDELIWIIL